MSGDYSLAARELERLRTDLRTMGKEGPEAVARLSDIARAFSLPGVIRDAAHAVVQARTGFEPKKVETAAAQWFATCLRDRLVESLGEVDPMISRLTGVGAPIQRLRARVRWRGAEHDVTVVLSNLVSGSAWEALSLADCAVLEEGVWPALSLTFGELKGWAKLNKEDELDALERLHERAMFDVALVGKIKEQAFQMVHVAHAADEAKTLRQLERLHHAMECLRSGAAHSNLVILGWEEFSVLELANRTDRLISATVAQLALGPVRANAVRRLKTWIERWEKEAALAGIKQRREAALQEMVDKFLYAEGLYPITHAQAGVGRVDTFIAESSPLFSEALGLGQPSILIELKQVTGLSNSGVTALRSKILEGLAQAKEYSVHLASNPEWANHDVFCVVAYDGPKRYQVDDARVTLLYLGDAVPSDGATLIKLNGSSVA